MLDAINAFHILLTHGPHFNRAAIVFQPRTLLRDLNRFSFVCHAKMEITGNGFLGFGKRTIGNRSSLLAGNQFARVQQRQSAQALALGGEPLKPRIPFGDDFFQFLRWQIPLPGVAAFSSSDEGYFRV